MPPTIVDLVGGSHIGGASIKKPKAGWDNKAKGDIFSVRNPLPSEENFQFPNPNTISPTMTPPWDKTHRSNKNILLVVL